MQAEIILTPTESKKLIAKAILVQEEVRAALQKGIVALHPSSSTIFIYEALTGRLPEGVWVQGVTAPRGLCISKEGLAGRAARPAGPPDPLNYPNTWFFKDGRLQERTTLGRILDQMTETDVYVKGSNALDPQGNVGVLYANPAGGGGTIGRVMAARRRQGFHLLLPIGIEKLIPIAISDAVKKAGFKKVDMVMGLPCGLIPVAGKKIDEVDALAILSGVEATPIAAGGLGGAEGAVVLAIHGTDEQVRKAYELCRSVKGATLPPLKLLDCDECVYPTCHFAQGRKKD
jgi:hypothetical protein